MDLRPVLYVMGILLLALAASMFLPLLADLYVDNEDWKVFFVCMTLTAFFGGSLIISNTADEFSINIRQTFLITVLSWVVLSIFAALPFKLSNLNMDTVDAYFEAVSGITTTGATVIEHLDGQPPGILLWRALLQWLGGIGIIVMALSIMPLLKVGGMQLFRTESSDSEKTMPRTAQLSYSLALIYVLLSLICAIAYMFTGMTPFEAITHAMTTLSTGGFSTSSQSIAYFQNPWTEFVAIAFMIISGMPFVLYLKGLRGSPGNILQDSQVRVYLSIITVSIIVLATSLQTFLNYDISESFRHSSFAVVSVMTGTGYGTVNYAAWGGFATSILLFLMVVGGCAGSTTSGIKIFRFQVIYEVANAQIKRLLHPHGMFVPRYNKRPIPEDAIISVMGFFFVFAVFFVIGVIALSYTGLDFVTAISSVATTISNVGPGLGEIVGPHGSFKPLPETAKWILCACMMIGRLEFFTVLVLLNPYFWRA